MPPAPPPSTDGAFADRGVLITGGTSGIGLACAQAFSRAGARVTVTYHADEGQAAAAVDSLGGPEVVHAVRSDARQESGANDAIRAAAEWGSVDVLVNNVGGVLRRTPALQLDPALWRSVMALNVDSAYYFSRSVLPEMIERGSGSIINISAHAAKNGGAGNGSIPYAVAKAGVEAMTVGLARDLANTGVRVNVVQVGLVDTPLHGATEFDPVYGQKEDFFGRVSQLTPMGRAADPAEIAACVLFLASDDASYVTGAVLQATGGM